MYATAPSRGGSRDAGGRRPFTARDVRVHVPMYRLDTSTGQRTEGDDRARVRHPRTAAAGPDARLRAAQGALPAARGAPEHLVRLAVPRPEAVARGRLHHHR